MVARRPRTVRAFIFTVFALSSMLPLVVTADYILTVFAHVNSRFQFENVAAVVKKMSAESFRQPQSIPKCLTALSHFVIPPSVEMSRERR